MERIVLLLAALSGAAGFDVAVDKQAVLAATTVLTAEHDSSIDDVALSDSFDTLRACGAALCGGRRDGCV